MRVGDLEHRRVDEPAGGVVGAAADDDQPFGTGPRERLGVLGELGRVDHGADERLRLGSGRRPRPGSVSSISRCLSAGQRLRGAYSRDGAEHFCPWYS